MGYAFWIDGWVTSLGARYAIGRLPRTTSAGIQEAYVVGRGVVRREREEARPFVYRARALMLRPAPERLHRECPDAIGALSFPAGAGEAVDQLRACHQCAAAEGPAAMLGRQ